MRILKKYANRRLYDTKNSCYITLEDVRVLIVNFQSVKIIEASSGEEITDQVLLQIITNQENNKSHKQIFTRNLLEQLIRVYSYDQGNSLSDFLERSLTFFVDSSKDQVKNPFEMWMNLGQKQFEIWQKAFVPADTTKPDKNKDQS